MKATLLLTQLLCAALTVAAANDVPRIVSVQLHGSDLFLTVELPPGIERVSLESCRRHDLSGWVPRASQWVNGAAKIKMVVSVTSADMEIFRLRAEKDDPLPATFYSGEIDFRPARVREPSIPVGDTFQTTPLATLDAACVYVIPGLGGDVQVPPNDPVDRVIPVGDWLIRFSSTEVLVSAIDAPDVAVRRYALDALQVLGAVRDGSKIHVLQGRAASRFTGIIIFDVTGASPVSEEGLLQHTIIDIDNLPELIVVGTASMETTNTAPLVDAKAVWPEPGLLVWSLKQEQGFMTYNFPLLTLTTGFGIRLDFAQPITWGPFYSPLALMQTRVACSFVAVDVSDMESPRVLSETLVPRGASTVSEAYGARGLVLYSHAQDESVIVATNSVLETNYVQVTVTNLVQRTNYVAEPVIVTETNATLSARASKLHWHEPLTGSQFAGGWSHSLGLQGDGRVLGWGANRCGEVNGGSSAVVEPASVPLPEPIVRIAAGDWQSLAVTAEGVVWQWGDFDGPMPPWPGEQPRHLLGPTIVPVPASVVNVSAGGSHAMALSSDGRLWTWGRNEDGALGRDGPESEALLVQGNFGAICAGWMHSLALTTNGVVYSWGWNDYGQLGRSGPAERPGRVELPDGIRFHAISAGAVHSLALAEDGVVWRWGDPIGVLRSPAELAERSPSPVNGLPPIRKIVSGSGHTLALSENGEVWFLGDDGATPFIFARVDSLTNVIEIGAGSMHSFALTAAGDLFIWGWDLPVISGRGEATQLSFTSFLPLVEARTNYVIVTNIVAELQVTEQSQAVVVTNTTPVYQHLRRHWLDVVDYRQDPLAPVVREPVSLPGALQGISHGGALLYTMDGGDSAFGVGEVSLSALAYDGISAHRVDTKLLATNSSALPIGVHPSGWVAVARDYSTSEHAIECWRLTAQGQLERAGQAALSGSSEALVLIDDLAVVRTTTGFALIDLADPSAPAALPINEDVRRQSGAIQRIAGDRQSGLWVPVGGVGTLPLWRP